MQLTNEQETAEGSITMNSSKTRQHRMGISVCGLSLLLMTWATTGYSGEWEPNIPNIVRGAIEIEIKNQQFTTPETGTVGDHLLVVPEGITVRWVNKDPLNTIHGDQGLMPHGIEVIDEVEEVLSASPILTKEQDSFSQTFEEAGNYTYNCFIHPFMKGTIVVVSVHKHK
jgi:plastocyanin